MTRTFYIETYGCQMNVADAELMAGILRKQGYTSAARAEDADVVLLNTCAVREKAEDRIFGRLGWLKPLKQQRPELILGVAGCMAEHLRDQLSTRTPHVDLVVGPDAYRRLPELIECAHLASDPTVDVRLDKTELYDQLQVERAPGVSGYVSITRGCDKFCTFCIVPYVRGRERSLPPDEVVRQVRELADAGYQEVILLGQTVSSYKEGDCDFAELLTRVHEVDGIARIRFTSPYPNDFDDRLLQTIDTLPKVARHLHLPVQSGSTKVLADMRRGYSADDYLALVMRIRGNMPDVSLTTDIIVGYPDETEADFAQTLELCEAACFDSAFMFKYSERSLTQAARTRPDTIDDEIKSERLQRLIALQHRCSQTRSALKVGQEVEVLIEGVNPKDPSQAMGRSSCFKTTMIDGDFPLGTMCRATVHSATTHTLFAKATGEREEF